MNEPEPPVVDVVRVVSCPESMIAFETASKTVGVLYTVNVLVAVIVFGVPVVLSVIDPVNVDKPRQFEFGGLNVNE